MALTIEGLLLKLKHRKMVVIVAPLLMGAYLALAFIGRPMMDKISLVNSEKTGLDQKASTLTSILAAEKKLGAYRDRLVPIEERSKLIEALNILAGKSGLAISSVTPEEKTSMGLYLEKVLVKIEAEGNYHQLADFVSHIENLQQFAKVMNIEINLDSPENVALASRSVGLNPNGSIKSGHLKSYKITVDIGFFSLQKGSL